MEIEEHTIFYKRIPYIMAIIVLVVFSDKLSHLSSFYIAIFLLGMSNVALMVLGINELGFYVNETMLQWGLGIGDLFIWTVVGHVGHLYGRPYRITSFALVSLLTSVFLGRILGIIFSSSPDGGLYTIAVSFSTVFVTILITPKLFDTIDRQVVKIKEENKFEKKVNTLTEREL
jgi:hypothetical protein